jgi:hypothetical protein
MDVGIEKILCTVLDETHKRQVEETIISSRRSRRGSTRAPKTSAGILRGFGILPLVLLVHCFTTRYIYPKPRGKRR